MVVERTENVLQILLKRVIQRNYDLCYCYQAFFHFIFVFNILIFVTEDVNAIKNLEIVILYNFHCAKLMMIVEWMVYVQVAGKSNSGLKK